MFYMKKMCTRKCFWFWRLTKQLQEQPVSVVRRESSRYLKVQSKSSTPYNFSWQKVPLPPVSSGLVARLVCQQGSEKDKFLEMKLLKRFFTGLLILTSDINPQNLR